MRMAKELRVNPWQRLDDTTVERMWDAWSYAKRGSVWARAYWDEIDGWKGCLIRQLGKVLCWVPNLFIGCHYCHWEYPGYKTSEGDCQIHMDWPPEPPLRVRRTGTIAPYKPSLEELKQLHIENIQPQKEGGGKR